MTAVWIVILVLGVYVGVWDGVGKRRAERDCLEYLNSPEAYFKNHPYEANYYIQHSPENPQQLYRESMDNTCADFIKKKPA